MIPSHARLLTADVYREADRQGLPRGAGALAEAAGELKRHGGALGAGRVVNDLKPAARALCPAIDQALGAARDVGADPALVCGSGPTVIGLFADLPAAQAAAARLADRDPRPLGVAPLEAAA